MGEPGTTAPYHCQEGSSPLVNEALEGQEESGRGGRVDGGAQVHRSGGNVFFRCPSSGGRG